MVLGCNNVVNKGVKLEEYLRKEGRVESGVLGRNGLDKELVEEVIGVFEEYLED